jgi:hypothetical protein
MTYQHMGTARAKTLDDAGQRQLEALPGKRKLSQYERGALRALATAAAPADRERALDRLRTGGSAQASRVSDKTIEQWAAAIDKALERYEEDRR